MTDKIKKPEKKSDENVGEYKQYRVWGYNQACDDWEKYLINAGYVKRDKIRIDEGKIKEIIIEKEQTLHYTFQHSINYLTINYLTELAHAIAQNPEIIK